MAIDGAARYFGLSILNDKAGFQSEQAHSAVKYREFAKLWQTAG
ncbi:hypothetical protein CPter91_1453 [Collimonas pratensis]|uniref:Uncharacterized protein n=1 Tax=Collimonas pratensis TaxID=279113 RepID=A0A127Q1C9_9BURK|nr:hypothetical protein CPter91_1453 [Collimonas pratensis]